MSILHNIAYIHDLYPTTMVLIPDLCLMADDSIYLQNIYSGKVITLSRKQAADLQYYYRRSKIPSDDNEYIYDYTYDRVESILRLIVGKYKRANILNIKQIHEYELSYEFYEQYYPRIISFQNISKDVMERVMANKKISIEFWLDKIVELSDFSNNEAYYLDMVGTLFRCSPYINELYDRYRKLRIYNKYFMYSDINTLTSILKNHKNINIELFEKMLKFRIDPNFHPNIAINDAIIKSICECNLSNPQLFKKHKDRILEISGVSEYKFYNHLLPTNIDIDNIFSFMDRDYMNRSRDEYCDIIGHIFAKNINYTVVQLQSLLSKLDNLGDIYDPVGIVNIFENKLLSREIIESIIIPKINHIRQDRDINISVYEDIIVTNPNVYREDLVLLGINIYECQPDYLLSNPNMVISNKEDIFDILMFNRDNIESVEFLSHPRIIESDIIYFINRYLSYILNKDIEHCYDWDQSDIFKWLVRNPNLTEYALSLIIKASQLDNDISQHKIHDIDWIAVFNNPNISIKYIEKIFRKHPDLFA